MTVKLGIVMDALDHIKPAVDTSFALLLEAKRRGYALYHMGIGDLSLEKREVYARLRPLQVEDRAENYHDLGEPQDMPLRQLDIVLMRQEPPVDMEYIYATHLLELAEQAGTVVINTPRGLRNANEKLLIFRFPQYIAPTLVTRQARQIRSFLDRHGDMILKPLDGMAGRSIFRLRQGNPNRDSLIETLTAGERVYIMAQAYLPAIRQGDKRIHIIDGKVAPYCLVRLPPPDDNRANMAAGGQGVPAPLGDTERQIAEAIAPELKKTGLLFVGLDMIGDKITEINVTAPTGIRQVEAAYGINLLAPLFDAAEDKLPRRA